MKDDDAGSRESFGARIQVGGSLGSFPPRAWRRLLDGGCFFGRDELFVDRLGGIREEVCLVRRRLLLLVLALLLASPLLSHGLLALELCHGRLSL